MNLEEIMQAIESLAPEQRQAIEKWWTARGKTPEALGELMDAMPVEAWRRMIKLACSSRLLWTVKYEREVTHKATVIVEAENEHAARLAAYEYLEDHHSDNDRWGWDYGEYEMSADPADLDEHPEIRAMDDEGGYERVEE